MKTIIAAGLMAAGATVSVFTGFAVMSTPAHAVPVFDSANYAQNLLTAARTLQQINQQIQSLQNEARMLTNMEKNLARANFPELQQLQDTLQQIDRLMGQAQGIDFRVDGMESQFRRMFPQDFSRVLRSDERVRGAHARLDASMAGFRQTMGVQSQIIENVRSDAAALAAITARSQGAEGSLQVSQATNQLLALTAKQQFQLQQLMAVQFRSEAIEQARRVQAGQEARAATKTFLGTGTAYTPR